MPTVVLTQPMLFPWVGLLEQVRLADLVIYHDDIPYSKSGYVNRVQLKTAQGNQWMTIPVRKFKTGQYINQLEIADFKACRQTHLGVFRAAYHKAPFLKDALELLERVYAREETSLSELVIHSFEEVCRYFDLGAPPFPRSSTMGIEIRDDKTARVLELVKKAGGNVYVTGHGALQYMDHERFDQAGIRVEYLNYLKTPYPQLHGPFNPFVSSLDLVANVGKEGKKYICSSTVPWREMVSRAPQVAA